MNFLESDFTGPSYALSKLMSDPNVHQFVQFVAKIKNMKGLGPV